MLYAFPNSKMLFIRGGETDVIAVENMIANFDQPEGQAEMKVYTAEISSSANRGGVKNARSAMKMIEQQLALNHVQVDTAMTLLRRCIDDQLKAIYSTLSSTGQINADVSKMTEKTKLTEQYLLWTEFYDKKVIVSLGLGDQPDSYVLLQKSLPRPTVIPTLAEALVVLALANPQYRVNIIRNFVNALPQQTNNEVRRLAYVEDAFKNEVIGATNAQFPPTGPAAPNFIDSKESSVPFSNLVRLYLGKEIDDFSTGEKSTDPLYTFEQPDVAAFQQEILSQLINNAISNMILLMNDQESQDNYYAKQMNQLDSKLEPIGLRIRSELSTISSAVSAYTAANKAVDSANKAVGDAKTAEQTATANARNYANKANSIAKYAQDMDSRKQSTAADAAAKAAAYKKSKSAATAAALKKAQDAASAANTAAEYASIAAANAKADKVSSAADMSKAVAEETAAKSLQTSDAKTLELYRVILLADIDRFLNDVKTNGSSAKAAIAERCTLTKLRVGVIGKMIFPAKYVFSTFHVPAGSIQDEADIFIEKLQNDQNQIEADFNKLAPPVPPAKADPKSTYSKLMDLQTALLSSAPDPLRSADEFKVGQANITSKITTLTDDPLSLTMSPVVDPLADFESSGIANIVLQAQGQRDSDAYIRQHSQVAKLNETLKRFIHAADQDIKGQYMRPMLERLQNDLDSIGGLSISIFTETSILASNRLVAKVDAKGSAEVALGDQVNILQQSIQLAQLLGAALPAAAKSATGTSAAGAATTVVGAAATGGATVAAGGTVAAISSVLNGLNALPADAPPTVYGISTGNVFQVTPIFDPTGQALRFRFDYVAANQVREPDNTTNPALPRIERHSVNTEVQVSNFEMKNVSTFVANDRLGLPMKFTGGIPGLLMDLPVIKYIPVIWMVFV